jgi:hypothetical protein
MPPWRQARAARRRSLSRLSPRRRSARRRRARQLRRRRRRRRRRARLQRRRQRKAQRRKPSPSPAAADGRRAASAASPSPPHLALVGLDDGGDAEDLVAMLAARHPKRRALHSPNNTCARGLVFRAQPCKQCKPSATSTASPRAVGTLFVVAVKQRCLAHLPPDARPQHQAGPDPRFRAAPRRACAF